MNLAAIRTFLAIVETGSLVRASERLNVTQSTVTARLQGLEAALGQPLFRRHKSGAQLTAAGGRFKRYAEAMDGLWRQARQDTALPEGVETICSVGCLNGLYATRGRALQRAIRRVRPASALSVWPAAASEIGPWLDAGMVDIAITDRAEARSGRMLRTLPPERLILASTDPKAPLRHDPGYVFVDNGEAYGRAHHAFYADADTARLTFGAPEWALEHMLAEGGSAYLPAALAAPYLEAGRLHRIAGAPEFSRPVYLLANEAAAGWSWLDDALSAM